MTHTRDEQGVSSEFQGTFPRRLPVFEGYTVDERLGEFRKASLAHGLEVVPFRSRKGVRLLARWGVHQLRGLQHPSGVSS